MKLLNYLFILALCLNCLSASPENEKIEKQLLKQIDSERMAYQLYTDLYKEHPEIKIIKGMIADKKGHFTALANYAKDNHPDVRIGQIKGNFLVRDTKKLYDDWLKEGKTSVKNAIEVGIELEELEAEEATDFIRLKPQPGLIDILNDLKRESKKNHAAFRRLKTRL